MSDRVDVSNQQEAREVIAEAFQPWLQFIDPDDAEPMADAALAALEQAGYSVGRYEQVGWKDGRGIVYHALSGAVPVFLRLDDKGGK